MYKNKPEHASKSISDEADEKLRRWLSKENIEPYLSDKDPSKDDKIRFQPYIAISREVGSNAKQIAQLVAEQLGWELLGKELLDHMAKSYGLPRDMLDYLDETSANWLIERFSKWVDWHTINQEEYVRRLALIVHIAAHHGSVVFLGRGAQFFLPQNRGLTVRIVAPTDFRIENIIKERDMSREEAVEYLKKTDEGRRDFVDRYFHKKISDASLYDMVFNSSTIDAELAASFIVKTYAARWGRSKPAQPKERMDKKDKDAWFVNA